MTEVAGSGQSAPSPRLVTIVLNTNRRDDTLACLASLAAQTAAAENHVIVLDNRSQDGSVDAIVREFPCVEILRLEVDLGYAGNNNVGVRAALTRNPEWILLLNEDTVLDPDCLRQLLSAGDADQSVGALGPLVLHHDEPNVIQSAGGRLGRYWIPHHIGANQPRTQEVAATCDVDWVSGCALMVRCALLHRVGLLDERFYYYWEETEWCVRMCQAGWRILHVPAAVLWHKGVQRNYRPSPNVTYYNTRNRFLLYTTHRPPFAVWLVAWGQVLRTLASWSLRPKWRGMRAHRDAMLEGIGDYAGGRWGKRVHPPT